jgi:hypothetical protein
MANLKAMVSQQVMDSHQVMVSHPVMDSHTDMDSQCQDMDNQDMDNQCPDMDNQDTDNQCPDTDSQATVSSQVMGSNMGSHIRKCATATPVIQCNGLIQFHSPTSPKVWTKSSAISALRRSPSLTGTITANHAAPTCARIAVVQG